MDSRSGILPSAVVHVSGTLSSIELRPGDMVLLDSSYVLAVVRGLIYALLRSGSTGSFPRVYLLGLWGPIKLLLYRIIPFF